MLDETFIGLSVPEEKRRSADEHLCKSGVRQGALRIAIGVGASYGSAKCWPPPRFAEVANRLQSETDADVILFIYRDEVYKPDSPDKGTAEILISKQRNGPTGKVTLTFRGEYTRFENYTAGGH